MEMEKLDFNAAMAALPPVRRIADFYERGCPLKEKIVVLDDDPTGVQTVHDVAVRTTWDADSLADELSREGRMFFVLTNSRGLSAADSEAQHAQIVQNLAEAARRTGTAFTLVSRGDSTLRGHYPLETATLRRGLAAAGYPDVDGEIIAPFFPEGGRYTIGDVHYVREGDCLVPAGQTEFARDTTFGYRASDLKDWVREKDPALPKDARFHSISIDMLRIGGEDAVFDALMRVGRFEKVIVNAADYADMEVFVTGLYRAMNAGKRFMFRTAAGLVRVLGAIRQKPLLSGAELAADTQNGGLVVVGSHVKKMTDQLERLLTLPFAVPIELDVNRLEDADAEAYVASLSERAQKAMAEGDCAVVFTSRKVVRKTAGNSEANLAFSLCVSGALVSIVRRIPQAPGFIIAKGGITSSDIGVKGLGVRRAWVPGQALPGIPVWTLGPESRFPGVHYVVFPGNVGGEDALMRVAENAYKRTK